MATDLQSDHILQWQDLKLSEGWTLVRVAILKRIGSHQSALTKASTTLSMEDVRKVQGAIEELSWLLGLPDREIEKAKEASSRG